MENSFKFFKNEKCEYYPCHKGFSKEDDFNCLFCYCPLYFLDECPGSYKIIKTREGKEIKSCMDCDFPHRPENYGKIIKFLSDKMKKL